jgi:hypothetical protein
VEISIVILEATRQTFALRYTVPVKGGVGRVEEGPYDGVLVRRVNTNDMETTYLASGKKVRSTRAVVAKDGRSMTSIGRVLGSSGKSSKWLMFFQKQ